MPSTEYRRTSATCWRAWTSTHTVDTQFGLVNLRIVANPVVDGDSKRIGTVVQWIDRTQEVAARAGSADDRGQGDRRRFDRTDSGGRQRRVLQGPRHWHEQPHRQHVGHGSHYRSGRRRSAVQCRGDLRRQYQLGQRTEEQSASLEETASSMEEMTTTVKQTLPTTQRRPISSPLAARAARSAAARS